MKQEQQFIYFRESFIQSFLSDTYSFAVMVFSFWINAEYIGSKLLGALLLVMFLLWMMGKGMSKAKKFYSLKELKEYVNKL